MPLLESFQASTCSTEEVSSVLIILVLFPVYFLCGPEKHQCRSLFLARVQHLIYVSVRENRDDRIIRSLIVAAGVQGSE